MIIIQNLILNLHCLSLNPNKMVTEKTFQANLRVLLWEVIAQNVLLCVFSKDTGCQYKWVSDCLEQ